MRLSAKESGTLLTVALLHWRQQNRPRLEVADSRAKTLGARELAEAGPRTCGEEVSVWCRCDADEVLESLSGLVAPPDGVIERGEVGARPRVHRKRPKFFEKVIFRLGVSLQTDERLRG